MRFAVLFPLLLATACGDPTEKDDGGESDAPPINQGDDTGGEQHAPVVNGLAFDQCVYPFADEGDQPAVLVSAHATDEDADIHVISMSVWWDEVVDGTVDVSGNPKTTTDPYHVSDDDGNLLSAADDVTFGTWLNVNGDDDWLHFSTDTEFGVIVYDNAGNASEPGIDHYVTPAEDLSTPCE